VLVLGLVVAWSLTQSAHAQPMLHEYIAPQAAEDVKLESTNPSGQLPAAVRTPSGTITPPDTTTTPEPRRIYHEGSDLAPGFRPDRDTRRPNGEQYDDPFSPTLTPFKRMHAYDAVRPDYTLYVRDTQYRPIAVGGTPRDGDDRFFGDMVVQVRAGQRVRIPTVGPDARLLELVTDPKTDLSAWRDGADNWFVLGNESARVRVISHLAITRDAFASEFADVAWGALPRVPLQPAAHGRAFRRVAKAIDISRTTMSPRDVVVKMVSYFRSFAPSNEPLGSEGDIYLDLALSKKGVCRHRAFAFLVTALNIGIPARLIHNEAHAWVEVRDDSLWHRIDLGGAAVDLDEDPHLDRPPHVPPPDQFPWPTGRDSGADLAHRERSDALRDRAESDDSDPRSTDPSAPSRDDPSQPGDPKAPNPARDLPATKLGVDTIDRDIFRGLPVRIKGTARSEGQPCAHLRIDVVLLIKGGNAQRRLGSLSTDERGVYDGAVVMPRDIPIGDHELVVATPGGVRCGPGHAQ